MKIIWKILIAIAVLLVLLVAITHFILQAKLGAVINRTIIPEMEKTLDLDVDIDDAGINLLGGSLRLSGVRLGNPDNFKEPTVFSMDNCKVNIGIISTIKGIFEVTEVSVNNAVITIVRNKDNQVNTTEISKSLPAPEKTKEIPEVKPEAPQPKPNKHAKTEPLELPPFLIKELSLETKLEYIDHKLRKNVTRIALQTEINVSNLTSVDSPDAGEATLKINAHLDGKPNLFQTSLEGKIQPVTDPLKPTFTLNGTVASIDLSSDGIKELCEKAKIKAATAFIDIHLTCIDGVYQQPASIMTLNFKNCIPTGDLAKKFPDFPGIKMLTVPMHLEGTFPDLRFTDPPLTTIINAILQNLATNANVLMDFLGKKTKKHDDKIQSGSKKAEEQIKKELDRGIESFGKFLKDL